MKDALRVLQEAGWFAGRRVDTKPYKAFLVSEGCLYHDAADAFLSEFGGLFIQFPHPAEPSCKLDVDIDPIIALEATWLENVIETSEALKKELCVVGGVKQHLGTLLMAQDASTYIDFSGLIIFAGRSGIEALEAIIRWEHLTEVIQAP